MSPLPKITLNDGISFGWNNAELTITIPRDALTFRQFSILIGLINNISQWKFRVVRYDEHIELVSVSRCRDDCSILQCSIGIEAWSNIDIDMHVYLSCFDTVRFSRDIMRGLYYYQIDDFRVKMSDEIGLTPEILKQLEFMLHKINDYIPE